MKLLVYICMMLTFPLLSRPAVVRADAATEIKAAIQAEDDKGDVAYARKDVAGCTAFDAPMYTHIGLNGKKTTLSRDQMRGLLQSIFTHVSSIRSKSTVQSVTLSHGAATVVEKAKTTFIVPRASRNIAITVDSVEKQVWIKSGSLWLEQKSWTLSSKSSTVPVPDAVVSPPA